MSLITTTPTAGQRHRKLAINPVTGAMQLVVLEDAVEQAASPACGKHDTSRKTCARPLRPVEGSRAAQPWSPRRPTASRSDDQVRGRAGCAAVFTTSRGLRGPLPCCCRRYGDSVLQARETRVDRPIDTTDFSGSLETPESQARFVVVDGEDELTAIMNAPLAQWRVFLHPTQRTLATGDRSGPVRVLGGAGTGKTVLAMHRAKWLAENRTAEGKKVLFTTFTRNLAFDIEENLNSLLPGGDDEEDRGPQSRRLGARVPAAQKYEHTIVYNRKKDASDAWQRALAVKDATLGAARQFLRGGTGSGDSGPGRHQQGRVPRCPTCRSRRCPDAPKARRDLASVRGVPRSAR